MVQSWCHHEIGNTRRLTAEELVRAVSKVQENVFKVCKVPQKHRPGLVQRICAVWLRGVGSKADFTNPLTKVTMHVRYGMDSKLHLAPAKFQLFFAFLGRLLLAEMHQHRARVLEDFRVVQNDGHFSNRNNLLEPARLHTVGYDMHRVRRFHLFQRKKHGLRIRTATLSIRLTVRSPTHKNIQRLQRQLRQRPTVPNPRHAVHHIPHKRGHVLLRQSKHALPAVRRHEAALRRWVEEVEEVEQAGLERGEAEPRVADVAAVVGVPASSAAAVESFDVGVEGGKSGAEVLVVGKKL
mmetsp:Transcript_4692/g.12128  ORF Transcript_4692/g.12128 Transcript_4692/m.12128 type:complete len:295 (-) Transcript_4692:1204-2088(-)